jgi:hypothetical protein
VHQTLSHAHTRRFVDAALFERLFLRSLELCKQHGLVERTHLSIDGFHAEADAALASLRASLALAAAPEAGAGGDAEPPAGSAPSPAGKLALEPPAAGQPGGERPALTLAEALRPDAEAAQLERDLGLCYRPGGEAARQAGSAAASRLPRPGGGRPQAARDRRLPRRASRRLRGRRSRPAARPRPLCLPRARLDRRRLGIRGRTRLAGGGAAPDHRLHLPCKQALLGPNVRTRHGPNRQSGREQRALNA